VYMREGGTTTLISTGPLNADALFPSTFKGASKDGSRVFFDTSANLVPTAGGTYPDVYERYDNATTLISTGPIGGHGDFFAFFGGASDGGTKVFFETDEVLLTGDTDTSPDVYASSISPGGPTGYPRPKGATPLRLSLVPAYESCTAPNREHGPSLAFGSCNPPAQRSAHLTVGTPDAFPGTAANFVGSVTLTTIAGVPATPADEADIRITVSILDIRRRSDLADYGGQLGLDLTTRITDRLNGPSQGEPGTVGDLTFPATIPCTTTPAVATIGSDCSLITTADAVMPGAVRETKRTMWQLGSVAVTDGGADGIASTAPNTRFLTQGVFIP
jgi:hypothetical protein